MTITEAFEAFEIDELESEERSPKTIASYRSTCSTLLEGIGGDIDIAFFAYTHIIQWKREMHLRNNSGAHMALQLRELRRVLAYLKSHNFATLDPTEIKIPKFKYRKTAWLTIEEISRFIRAVDKPRDKALFACMFSSGARVSEMLALDRSSIVDGRAVVWGKGKVKGRDEPDILEFDDNALGLLEEYLDGRADDLEPLFVSLQRRRLSLQQAIVSFNGYFKKAGIEKRGRGATHILRHSFATDLELNGLDIRGIQVQMRHQKLENTKGYMHGEILRKTPDYRKHHTPVPLR